MTERVQRIVIHSAEYPQYTGETGRVLRRADTGATLEAWYVVRFDQIALEALFPLSDLRTTG